MARTIEARSAVPTPVRAAIAAVLALVLLAVAPPANAQAAHLLRGTITSDDGNPVASALVRVSGGSQPEIWIRTGADGGYTLRLPAVLSALLVRVQRIGYAPYETTIDVRDARTLVHDVRLVSRPTLLDAVQVRGDPVTVRTVPGGHGGSAAGRDAGSFAFTTADVGSFTDAALLVPGVVPVDAGASGMPGVSIGGQAPGQNRVTADGARFGGAALPAEGIKGVGVVAETYDVARGQFTGGQIAASTWWLARFRYGPAEWLWRRLTYARPLPMRAGPVPSARPAAETPAEALV